MELTFTKDGNAYVAEFEVTSEFNLHLEKKKPGKIELYQRTVNGKFAHVEDFDNENKFQNVFDFDSGVIAVTPKTIKIVSEVEPTYAAVTTSGEVTEIKSQSKEVEVTANGTMDITPDAGFAYLSAVKVKTNVPQEGGGSAVQADDVIWMASIYVGFPCMNVSKGTIIKWETGEIIPLPDEVVMGFASAFADYYALSGINSLMNISISNKTEPKLTFSEDSYGNIGPNGGMFTGITIEGIAVTESGAKEPFRGILVEGFNGANYGWILYLTDENRYFHQKYPYGSVTEVKITKFIASNGNEIIVPEF